jgi:hypothetical protein
VNRAKDDRPIANTSPAGLREDRNLGYVLMTAAHNEEANIEQTIKSVLSQTLLPTKWVIASDGSTDKTDEIVQEWADKYSLIHFLRITRPPGRSFKSKVLALRRAEELFNGIAWKFIGNLDADVCVGSSYFEELLAHFKNRPDLGIAGGFIYCQESDGEFHSQSFSSTRWVAHAAQLVRRECYEAIGGYAVLEYGGEDWYAETSARMNGWQAEALPQLRVLHYRRVGSRQSLLRYHFRAGRMDYSLGSYPPFEIVKCFRRLSKPPILLGGLTRLAGFMVSWLVRDKRPVPDEFVAFLKKDQGRRLLSCFTKVPQSMLNHERPPAE